MSVCLSDCMSVCLSVCMSVCLLFSHMSVSFVSKVLTFWRRARGPTGMVCARGPTEMVRTLSKFKNSPNSSGVRGRVGIRKERDARVARLPATLCACCTTVSHAMRVLHDCQPRYARIARLLATLCACCTTVSQTMRVLHDC